MTRPAIPPSLIIIFEPKPITVTSISSSFAVSTNCNSSKLEGPLLVVDPTYKFRNATAGLGKESLEKFLDVAKRFLKEPSSDFFELKEISLEELNEFALGNGASLLKVKLSTDRQEGDIAGTKMKKFFDYLVFEMNRLGQEVLRTEFDYSGFGKEAFGYLVVIEKNEVELKGPPVSNESGSKAFRASHKDFYERKGVLYVERKVSLKEIVKVSSEKVGSEMGASGEIF